MKKIGFINFYLSEWHANNYPAWIAEANAALPESDRCEVAYAWAEECVSPVDGLTSEQWCDKFGVTLCGSIEEVCEKSDYILILAPSNPEKHLLYAEKALPFGKNTYIDKTFAPDYETAKKIFDVAEKHGTKFFSTSALRFADEVKKATGTMYLFTGGGNNFDEYIIHQIEMAIAIIGRGADFVCVDEGTDQDPSKSGYGVKIHYADNRSATLVFAPQLGFSVCDDAGETPIRSDFFRNLIVEILKFYASGKLPFNPAETLEVARIREKAIEGKSRIGEWLPLWDDERRSCRRSRRG